LMMDFVLISFNARTSFQSFASFYLAFSESRNVVRSKPR